VCIALNMSDDDTIDIREDDDDVASSEHMDVASLVQVATAAATRKTDFVVAGAGASDDDEGEDKEDEDDTISSLSRRPVIADEGLVGMRNTTAKRILVAPSADVAAVDTPAWVPAASFRNAVIDAYVLWKPHNSDWSITPSTDTDTGEVPSLKVRVHCSETSFRETSVTASPSGKWTARLDATGKYTAYSTLAALLTDFRKYAQTTYLGPCLLKDALKLPTVHDYVWASDRFLGGDLLPDISKISPGQVTRNRNALKLADKHMEGMILKNVFVSQPHVTVWTLETPPHRPVILGYHAESKVYFLCGTNFETVYCSFSVEDLLDRARTLPA